MDNDFFKISGWAVAVVSLGVNIMQLFKNNALKKKVLTASQKVGDNSSADQQTHSGTGHNVNAGGDANIK